MFKQLGVWAGFICFYFLLTACSNDEKPADIDQAQKSHIGIELVDAFDGMRFEFPVYIRQDPLNRNDYYIVERRGKIYHVRLDESGQYVKTAYLDITDRVDTEREGGLLSIAFHPQFRNNGKLFLSYTETAAGGSGGVLNSVISSMTLDPSGDLPDISSEIRILEQIQPFANHNGGQILFGPDGLLYIGFGDGGSSGDPQNNGQNKNTLLGSLLRIDIDSDSPYAIPADNPFLDGNARAEIFAYGLRNPWRFSFDRQNADFWLGDVGQNRIEEINRVFPGTNYGWNCFEGSEVFQGNSCPQSFSAEPPATQYSHLEGSSVTGGYVYRGNAIAELVGDYVFGDFVSGAIWHLNKTGDDTYTRKLLFDSNLSIVSFAESNEGELLVVDFSSGRIFLIQPKND